MIPDRDVWAAAATVPDPPRVETAARMGSSFSARSIAERCNPGHGRETCGSTGEGGAFFWHRRHRSSGELAATFRRSLRASSQYGGANKPYVRDLSAKPRLPPEAGLFFFPRPLPFRPSSASIGRWNPPLKPSRGLLETVHRRVPRARSAASGGCQRAP